MPEHKKFLGSKTKRPLITEPKISPSAAVSLFVPKSTYLPIDRVCGINNLNLVIPKILSLTNLTSSEEVKGGII